jgi:FeS assembly SUF system regulator
MVHIVCEDPNMLRMSKLTDYATVVLGHLARSAGELQTAADVAARTGLSAPTVSKLLNGLARSGLVISHRGAQGGYMLARRAEEISAAEVIDALEGPVAITECSTLDGNCDLQPTCQVGGAWQRINAAIRRSLQDISLAELTARPGLAVPMIDLRGAVGRGTAARHQGDPV